MQYILCCAIFVCNHNRDYIQHIHVICTMSLIEKKIALHLVKICKSVTYQRELGARTLYCRLTMLTVLRNALLTGSTVFIASLRR